MIRENHLAAQRSDLAVDQLDRICVVPDSDWHKNIQLALNQTGARLTAIKMRGTAHAYPAISLDIARLDVFAYGETARLIVARNGGNIYSGEVLEGAQEAMTSLQSFIRSRGNNAPTASTVFHNHTWPRIVWLGTEEESSVT